MKERFLKYLCCPACKNDFILSTGYKEHDEIIQGTLTCEKCKKQYDIKSGVPRFVFNSIESDKQKTCCQ